jgi:acid stress-induced BolA-like protein IbaG/YrbA
VALQIVNAGVDVSQQLRAALERAFPGDTVEVSSESPGHFALRVVSAAFAGKSRVQQQQLVYAAIQPLMAGASAPVHAIDRMTTLTPEQAGR